MIDPFNALRPILASALLASGLSGAAVAAGQTSCDPMYPCYAAGGTPATVYDIAARIDGDRQPSAEGLDAELVQNGGATGGPASPAAVYDTAARTDQSPCQSYPCYVDDAAPQRSIAAGVSLASPGNAQSI